MPPKRKAGDQADRGADKQGTVSTGRAAVATEAGDDEANGLVFEDPFGDDFEEEDVVDGGGSSGSDEEDDAEDMDMEGEEDLEDLDEEGGEVKPPKAVWRPGVDPLEEGETLEYDPSAYVMYHSMRMEWPCLSFDILKDTYGEGRQRFPLSMFLVAGSQADRADRNKLTILKLSDMHKTQVRQENSDSEESEEEDDNVDEDPTLEHVHVQHVGAVNRIRAMPQNSGIVATMADTSHAHIFDISSVLRGFMQGAGPRPNPPNAPVFTFKGHKDEGYALDWSPVQAGRLASGDCAGAIHIWNAASAGGASSWQVDPTPYSGHTDSVEDIQWSPSEGSVFCSASADNTLKIWDVRGKTGPQLSVNAHDADVNVISWNKRVSYLLASGCDDGSFKVWDLRAIRNDAPPLANFRYHRGPITSLEWAPHDESLLCVASADNQVTIWDLSVEADEETNLSPDGGTLNEFPPQLLFIHQGQNNVKEVHFHPQIPGTILSTAEDSFNVFKPAITIASS
jgi:ribosome assembly protein RRB1